MVRPCGFPPVHFHCACGFGTRTLARLVDSLVRVSRRAACCYYASALAEARSSARAGRIAPWAITPPERLNSQGLSAAAQAGAGPLAGRVNGPVGPAEHPRSSSCRMRFPRNNFTCCLTLFSKCFSSFDHSTCALSVSGRYLALDGIYHPIRAAFPNNSTLRRGFAWRDLLPRHGALTL